MNVRKYLLAFFLVLATIPSFPKNNEVNKNLPQSVDVLQTNYELIKTSNVWVFLKLDTRNGKINQVHYSLDAESYRGELIINNESLLPVLDMEVPGRFALYPTTNTYNFILLDRIDGRLWQVQWSLKEENRFIIRIR